MPTTGKEFALTDLLVLILWTFILKMTYCFVTQAYNQKHWAVDNSDIHDHHTYICRVNICLPFSAKSLAGISLKADDFYRYPTHTMLQCNVLPPASALTLHPVLWNSLPFVTWMPFKMSYCISVFSLFFFFQLNFQKMCLQFFSDGLVILFCLYLFLQSLEMHFSTVYCPFNLL